jgi:cell wall assembly regulator SMI1
LAREEEAIQSASNFTDYDDEEDQRYSFEQEGMSSCPPGWVKNKYSHPGWIPLLSDRAGNYIGVDLDPPTQSISTTDSNDNDEAGESHGQSGQVIAFGREIDEKVVLFPGHTQGGWGRFLSSFVDDIERGEFAKLSLDQGSPKGRAAQSEDGDWEDGDGLGDRGYLEGARFGDEEDAMKEGGDGRVW